MGNDIWDKWYYLSWEWTEWWKQLTWWRLQQMIEPQKEEFEELYIHLFDLEVILYDEKLLDKTIYERVEHKEILSILIDIKKEYDQT